MNDFLLSLNEAPPVEVRWPFVLTMHMFVIVANLAEALVAWDFAGVIGAAMASVLLAWASRENYGY